MGWKGLVIRKFDFFQGFVFNDTLRIFSKNIELSSLDIRYNTTKKKLKRKGRRLNEITKPSFFCHNRKTERNI